MKVDNTIREIYSEIREEIKQQHSIELTDEDIQEIVKSQLDTTRIGIAKSVPVLWVGFCKFVFTNRKRSKKETREYATKILSDETLSIEEQEEKIKAFIVQKNIDKNNLKKLANGSITTTLEDLEKIETKSFKKDKTFTPKRALIKLTFLKDVKI